VLFLAALVIFVRSCFRVAELEGGYKGKLANSEVTFMILEGAMIAIGSIALTFSHPGFVFRQHWHKEAAKKSMLNGEAELKDLSARSSVNAA
jgi:hypothetical protein